MLREALSILCLLVINQLVFTQANPDDYWLNNGFTNGQTVITNSGYFYDDGGDGLYNEGQNWSVRFCSENSNPITFDFSGFRTHTPGIGTWSGYDYMRVNYTGIGGYIVYYNDTPEFSFTSPDGCMNFEFVSNTDGLVDSGWVAEIFALPPPFNNAPVNAEELVVGNTCSPSFYTNKGAYSTTSLGSPPCKTFFGGDVWFRLVVPPSGVVKIETFEGTLTYAILDIYRSADATITSGERIACIDDGGIMPSVTLTSPTVNPGDVLYVRLFGEQAKSGLFGICATDPTEPVTGFTGPGGVGDSLSLGFWYSVDHGLLNAADLPVTGGEQVETWMDRSGNDKHLVQVNNGFQPVYNENIINGFGALKFDGTDDVFSGSMDNGDAPLHWFVAGAFEGAQRQTILSVGDAVPDKTASLSMHSDYRYFSFTESDRYGPSVTDGQFYLFHAAHLLTTPFHFLELNGAPQTVDAVTTPLLSNGALRVGASWDGNDPFNGYASELIQYNKTLNLAQEIIVNNYLSAKYNIDLGVNDFYTHKDSFYYDVAGIGRVNAANIHTKAESAGILAISGADDLDNNEFLLFGHDNGDFSTWSSVNVPVGDTNIVRLERTWRVALAGGSPGEVTVSLKKSVLPALPAGFSAYNIMIDSDGDFSTGARTYGPFEIGDELVANNVTMDHWDHISIAAVRPVVSFTSATSAEFESVSNPQIEVVLNYAVSTIVEVNYSVVEATAQQGVDFSLLPSTISIDPGNKIGYIIPLIIDDTIPEIPDKYFDIEISTSTPGVTAGGITRIRHTILNDDLAIEIAASDTIIGACATSVSEIVAEAIGTGPFTYAWTPGEGLNVTDRDTVIANPSVTTTYTVEVTDIYGLAKTKNIEIVLVPLPPQPVVVAGGSTALCFGDSVMLSAPAGYAGYLWSTSEVTESIYLNTAGNYNVTVTDSFGCAGPVSDEVSVTVLPLPDAPVITPAGPTTFCEGDSVVLIAEAGYSSYLWSDTSTEGSLVVKTEGEYYVSGTGGNGCSSENSDTITVAVHPNPAQPVITASGATEFCPGDSVRLSAPSGYAGYLWSTGQTDSEVYASAEGDYNVTVTDANGCAGPVSDEVSVTVLSLPDAPVLTPDAPTTFCEGDSVVLVAEAGYISYLWSNASTEGSLVVKTEGEYYVSGTDGNGCTSENSDTITVAVHPNPAQPVTTASGATEFCPGDSARLSAPAGYAGYLWSTGQTDSEIYASAEGDYNVTVTDANGCLSPASEDVTITIYPVPDQPVITSDAPLVVYLGDSLQLTSSAAAGYLWQPNGETTGSIYVKNGGDYSVTVENEFGCQSIASEPVTVSEVNLLPPPDITVNGSVEFCEGDSVILSGPYGFAQYNWSSGDNGQQISVKEGGSISLIVANEEGTESSPSEELIIVVHELPEIMVGNLVEPSCAGFDNGSITVEATGGLSPYQFSWQGYAEVSSILSGITAGEYRSMVTDQNGCSEFIVIGLNEPEPLTVEEIVNLVYCPDFSDGSVELVISGGTEPYSISWDGGESGEYLFDLFPGAYSFEVRDGNDCSATGTVEVGYENEVCFMIPGIITPNDDSYNDTWKLDGIEVYPDVTIEIFDRWGKRVFYSEGYNQEFDGTYNGRKLPMESYHYVIDLHNGTERIVGNITIIR